MGIPRAVARLLLDEARERPFGGALLQLGRSTVYVRDDELSRWAAEQGATLAAGVEPELSHVPELAAQGCLSDRAFFRRLGFERVDSLDVSDWEGVDLVHDLNRPVPADWRERYDAVFEAGTLQHVFHLPNALASLHALLRPGGRAIHGMATSNNHVDHGFYMFSPTLFHDFYEANGWRLDAEYFFEFSAVWVRGRFASPPWKIRRYTPGCLDHLAYGGFGGGQTALYVAATKLEGATGDRAPQQGYFRRTWPELEAQGLGKLGAPAAPVRSARPPAALYFWKRLRAALLRRLPRRLPPVHRRY